MREERENRNERERERERERTEMREEEREREREKGERTERREEERQEREGRERERKRQEENLIPYFGHFFIQNFIISKPKTAKATVKATAKTTVTAKKCSIFKGSSKSASLKCFHSIMFTIFIVFNKKIQFLTISFLIENICIK